MIEVKFYILIIKSLLISFNIFLQTVLASVCQINFRAF